MTDALKTTPLHPLHLEWGGKMVPFAGYDMPVQYPTGIKTEHLHTRQRAGLFDVSHMGQAHLIGLTGDPAIVMERLVPGAIAVLKPGRMRYSLLLNDQGGIRDDLMITRLDDERLYLVVNAACKLADFAYIAAAIDGQAKLQELQDHALLALQGPMAVDVLAAVIPGVGELDFMSGASFDWQGQSIFVSRCGYTGEDGFEISIPSDASCDFARTLVADEHVLPIGLGARDSLRLEAGLCLYGHDIDETTTPVAASLTWAIGKKRREAGDFPGAAIILDQLAHGTANIRVGIKPLGKAPAREGTDILDDQGNSIGSITSGGFGPSFDGPVAMGYVPSRFSAPGTRIGLSVRGKIHEAEVTSLPFVRQNYVRKAG